MKPDENTNFYNPDEDDSSTPSAPKGDKKPAALTWTASEYIEHQRGSSWYVMLAGAVILISGILYFLTKDYFTTGIVIIVGIIVGVSVGHKPRQVAYGLDSSGLKVGEKQYNYTAFKSFSIIRDGALNSITLYPLKRFMPPISVYFDTKDEERITDIIGDHLPYEERKMDGIDKLSRRLKL